jgi:hypothetical protein
VFQQLKIKWSFDRCKKIYCDGEKKIEEIFIEIFVNMEGKSVNEKGKLL